MIIIWRWKSCCIFGSEFRPNKIYELLSKNNYFNLSASNNNVIHGFTKENEYAEKKEKVIIAEKSSYDLKKIEKKAFELSDEEGNQVLVLFHSATPDKINKLSDEFENKKKGNLKSFPFSGSRRENIYDELIDGGDKGDFKKEALETKNEQLKVKQENFINVWNQYYGQEEKESPAGKTEKKKTLEQKKNELVKLWLPLAIDIQGLSEVNLGKREDYFSEIIDYYSEKYTSDKDEITKILNKIKDDKIKNHIEKCRNLSKNIINILKDSSDKNGADNNFFDKYCNSKKTDSYLPALLQDLAEEFDEKIE